MNSFTKLYVDDVRDLPQEYGPEWTLSRTVHEALTKLDLLNFEEVSLDHDLGYFIGNRELTGYDILVWLVQRKLEGGHVPPIIRIHTANPAARTKMIDLAKQHFELKE